MDNLHVYIIFFNISYVLENVQKQEKEKEKHAVVKKNFECANGQFGNASIGQFGLIQVHQRDRNLYLRKYRNSFGLTTCKICPAINTIDLHISITCFEIV